MINVATSGSVTNDSAAIIYGQPPRTGPAKRAEVNHLSVAQPERVGRTVAARVCLAGDLVLVIDRIGNTPTAAECTERHQIDHLPTGVREGTIGAVRESRITGDVTLGIDSPPVAIFAAEGADVDELAVAVEKCRIGRVGGGGARFSRHLSAGVDALAITITAEAVPA